MTEAVFTKGISRKK